MSNITHFLPTGGQEEGVLGVEMAAVGAAAQLLAGKNITRRKFSQKPEDVRGNCFSLFRQSYYSVQ